MICVTAVAAGLATSAAAAPIAYRTDYTPGKIVPIPASIPHTKGAMVDSRIVPDLSYLAWRFPIYVWEGYAGPLPGVGHVGCVKCHVAHSDHFNGLAVDIVPLYWDGKGCDRSWRPVSRIAHWAEPRQNHPRLPFRWVGYIGDAGHGCGNHLHLSWYHAPARRFHVAKWVDVFDVPTAIPLPSWPLPPAPPVPPEGQD